MFVPPEDTFLRSEVRLIFRVRREVGFTCPI